MFETDPFYILFMLVVFWLMKIDDRYFGLFESLLLFQVALKLLPNLRCSSVKLPVAN